MRHSMMLMRAFVRTSRNVKLLRSSIEVCLTTAVVRCEKAKVYLEITSEKPNLRLPLKQISQSSARRSKKLENSIPKSQSKTSSSCMESQSQLIIDIEGANEKKPRVSVAKTGLG